VIVNERKHAVELRLQQDKQRQMKIELEQRSTLIAQLTNQLLREKQLQQQVQNRVRLGQIILPDKPSKLKSTNESSSTKRSSSLNHRASPNQELSKVLFIGRRPPTPPQQLRPLSSKSIESNDEQLYTKRQRQLLSSSSHADNVDMNKVSQSRPPVKLTTVLPPIISRKMPMKALTTTKFQQEGEV
jgi:hypothetical protein